MVKVVNEKNIDKGLFVGTHNGIFHCDEIVAIAILDVLNKGITNIHVIRSRDLEFLEKNTDILVDIGGGSFDHHQKGGNGQRENGVKYASAGLIWKVAGKHVISLLSNNELKSEEVNELVKIIDQDIIQCVDSEDNGQLALSHPFQFVRSFLPCWNKESNYDEKFKQCANIVSVELENIIETYISSFLAQKEIASRLSNPETHIGNVLVLPCQTIPWTNDIINYNGKTEETIDFVVFPYPDLTSGQFLK